ncbi:MAG: cytochrome c biogenesis protein [Actinomycetota bacterium]
MGSERKVSAVLPFTAVVAVMIAVALIFLYAPTEALQGEVQRIFYVHVPSAWLSYIGFFIAAGASVMLLRRRDDWERWDRIAVANVEVGLVFLTIVLTTGPIWAGRVWGQWWAWDARLTSTLVLWMIYAGYLLYRSLTPPGEHRARLSAVIALIGAIDIPVVHFAVNWWRSAHPDATVLRTGGPDLPSTMLLTLLISFLALLVLFIALAAIRIRIEESRTRVELLEAAHV